MCAHYWISNPFGVKRDAKRSTLPRSGSGQELAPTGLADRLAVFRDQPAAHKRLDRQSLDAPPRVGRPADLGDDILIPQFLFRLHIHEDEIRIGADVQAALAGPQSI